MNGHHRAKSAQPKEQDHERWPAAAQAAVERHSATCAEQAFNSRMTTPSRIRTTMDRFPLVDQRIATIIVS
jgi:hypothetical protein